MASANSLVAAVSIVAAVAGICAPSLASAIGHYGPGYCHTAQYSVQEAPELSLEDDFPTRMVSQTEFLALYEAGWHWEPLLWGKYASESCEVEAVAGKMVLDSVYFQRSGGIPETVEVRTIPTGEYPMRYLITGEYGIAGMEGVSRPISGTARESYSSFPAIDRYGTQRIPGYTIEISMNAKYDFFVTHSTWPYTKHVYSLDHPDCAWERSGEDQPPDSNRVWPYCWYAQSVRSQYLIGVPNDMINCPEGRDILMQTPSGRPACVYERSADKLEDRGFVRLGSPSSPT